MQMPELAVPAIDAMGFRVLVALQNGQSYDPRGVALSVCRDSIYFVIVLLETVAVLCTILFVEQTFLFKFDEIGSRYLRYHVRV
jgi:hypothetical protein